MYSFCILLVSVATLLSTTAASPLVRKSLNPKLLAARSPLSMDAFAADSVNWPTNVVFASSDQTYGLWVPQDGSWYDLGNIECLGLPSDAIGDCNDITISEIGVVAGYGPCRFVGSAGYSATISGGAGYSTVGPPQNIMSAACGA